MKKLAIPILLVIMLASVIPLVASQPGHLVLLTVAEVNGERVGGTADLFLDIKPGSGRIFIDSFPLTKLDTQISTRFANEVACQEYDLDCSRKDFFYTINADSTIVGGPSAGLGIAVLAAAQMMGLEMDEGVTITGTINSGGIAGPVSGIPEKVLAAQQRGLTKVLVPAWSSFNETNFENITGKPLTIEVVRVKTLDDALRELTGKSFEEDLGEIEISEKYTDRMGAIADILCDRTDFIASELGRNLTINFTQKVEAARNNSRHYTAASYCFSKNVELRSELLQNSTLAERINKMGQLSRAIGKLDSQTSKRELQTLSDLETYMVVKERLVDAAQSLTDLDLAEVDPDDLGYVIERYFSAVAWSQFFGLGGMPFSLEKAHLVKACRDKIAEAEERLDYIGTLSSIALSETRKDLGRAYKDENRGSYELCIFKATKVKAEANTFLMAVSISQNATPKVVGEKLEAVKKIILEQQQSGIFPILGYSYYEYADSLKNTDYYSSLLFSEYALEMSNLNLYFPEEEKFRLPVIDQRLLLVFLMGLALGLAIGASVMYIRHREEPKKRKSSR